MSFCSLPSRSLSVSRGFAARNRIRINRRIRLQEYLKSMQDAGYGMPQSPAELGFDKREGERLVPLSKGGVSHHVREHYRGQPSLRAGQVERESAVHMINPLWKVWPRQ